MSLYESFKNIELYYENGSNKSQFLECPTNKFAEKFIEDYFKSGHKEGVFKTDFINEYKQKGKHLHTVSLYLLGSHLKELIEETLKRYLLNNIGDIEDWWKFKYTWFITSLLHDTGSILESNEINALVPDQFRTLDYYLGKNDIKYNLFNYSEFEINSLNISSLKYQKDDSYFTFNEYVIKNYFYYRAKYMNVIDHGIITGYIVFDRLIKNYNQAWKEFKLEANIGCYSLFVLHNLNWRIEHHTHFIIIANAIMAHNIWFAEELENEIYKTYGLDPLTIENVERISIEKWPLLFYLGLIDTIEPIKRFGDQLEPEEIKRIWQSIDINVNDEEIIIEIIGDTIKQNDSSYRKWKKGIYDMKNWLNINIEPDREDDVDNTIKITPVCNNN